MKYLMFMEKTALKLLKYTFKLESSNITLGVIFKYWG